MKNTIYILLVGMVVTSASAAPITLANTDFTNDANGANPANWTTEENIAGAIGVQTSTIGSDKVLTFQARLTGNYIQQSFLTSEATAENFGEYTVEFESGWRNNTIGDKDLNLRVSIWNVTDGVELGFASYTFPPNDPSNLQDNYRKIGDQSLTVTYDNTAVGLVDDTIALRIASNSTQNWWDPTGWIDDIAVTSVPEPATMSLLALGGIAMLRRRK